MILQELASYYDRKQAQDEGALPPQGFEIKPIPFLVVLSPQGIFRGLEDTRESEGSGKRGRPFLVPQAVKRSSGVRANLLWDNVVYVFGINPEAEDPSLSEENRRRKLKRAKEQVDAFVKMIRDTLKNELSDAGVAAVLTFLEAGQYARQPALS